MLSVFESSVAHGPRELSSPSPVPANEGKSGSDIMSSFASESDDVLQVFLPFGGMAYTHHRQPLLRPRSFASVDGIFCLFEGTLENLTAMRQEYGLPKNTTEVMLVIEAYRTLRDRGPFPPDKVVNDFEGHFVFVLYDSKNNDVFVALDKEGKIPFYWGTATDGSLVFSDIAEVLKAGCGKSFAPFPAGCFFSSHVGIQSFEYPLQKIEPVPRVDSQGQELGAGFKVDMAHIDTARRDNMHKVGSEANWTESI